MEKRNAEGFLQHFDNPFVDRIQYKFDGSCTIFFKDGSTKDHFVGCDVVYNEQYGIPVSLDGRMLFVGSWEKGLTAYDTVTGERKWRYRPARIRSIFVYSDFLVVCRCGAALLKLDSHTGELIWEKKSGTMEEIHRLDDRYFFVDCLRGKYCVMDAMTMEIVKVYSPKTVNPSDCLSHVIREACLREGRLYIEGFEDYPNRNYRDSCQSNFYREIDPDFYGDLNPKGTQV